MYNIRLTDDLYFSGSYAKVGKVEGGIDIPSLPPTEDIDKQKFHRWDTHNVQTGVKRNPVMVQEKDEEGNLLWDDEEKTIPKMVQDTDEEGNPLFTEEPIFEDVLEWIFDEEGYNKWKEEQGAIVPKPTNEERIVTLNEIVVELTDMIISLAM